MLFMILKTFFDKNKWNLSNEIHIAYKKRYTLKNVKSLRGVNSVFGHSFRNGGVTKWPTEFWGQVYGSAQIRPMFKLLGQWQNGPQFFPRIPTDHTRVINPMNFSVTSLANWDKANWDKAAERAERHGESESKHGSPQKSTHRFGSL